jgi:hypothetical protein
LTMPAGATAAHLSVLGHSDLRDDLVVEGE